MDNHPILFRLQKSRQKNGDGLILHINVSCNICLWQVPWVRFYLSPETAKCVLDSHRHITLRNSEIENKSNEWIVWIYILSDHMGCVHMVTCYPDIMKGPGCIEYDKQFNVTFILFILNGNYIMILARIVRPTIYGYHTLWHPERTL